MTCNEHNFINENGFKCCITCGIATREHYWCIDLTRESCKNNILALRPMFFFSPHKNWKRLLQTNTNFTAEMSSFIHIEILNILNLLPFSSKTKKDLYNYIIKKKIKSYDEVCKIFYTLICKLDLPIITKDFIKILHYGRKDKYKPLTKLKNIKNITNIRKYYWYIGKQVEKAKEILNLSNEEAQDIYKIVLNYYNLIRFKMLKTSNPISLIQNLIYYTIREIIQPNQKTFNKRNFEIINILYMSTTLINYFKEIKAKELDSCFIEKLTFNKHL